jgi:hypothetical protein
MNVSLRISECLPALERRAVFSDSQFALRREQFRAAGNRSALLPDPVIRACPNPILKAPGRLDPDHRRAGHTN